MSDTNETPNPTATSTPTAGLPSKGTFTIEAIEGVLEPLPGSRKLPNPVLETPEIIEDVQEIYLVPSRPPGVANLDPSLFMRIFPAPAEPIRPWWTLVDRRVVCCPTTTDKLNIKLDLGFLPIDAQFYLLVTPVGQRCQFVVEWNAAGGTGQLTVDLEVREPGKAGWRLLADTVGPTDQFTFTGPRVPRPYLFRATVTDAQGQMAFDTLSVQCP